MTIGQLLEFIKYLIILIFVMLYLRFSGLCWNRVIPQHHKIYCIMQVGGMVTPAEESTGI